MKSSALLTMFRIVIRLGGTVLQVAVLIWVISYIAKTAHTAYDLGFRVFTEPPMQEAPGNPVAVAITEDNKGIKDVAKYLSDRGLIREPTLFMMQEFLSPYHNKIQPGFYELSTAMTADEMLAIMTASYSEETDTDAPEESDYDNSGDVGSDFNDNLDTDEETPVVPDIPDIPFEEQTE